MNGEGATSPFSSALSFLWELALKGVKLFPCRTTPAEPTKTGCAARLSCFIFWATHIRDRPIDVYMYRKYKHRERGT